MGYFPQHWYRGRPTAATDRMSVVHLGGNQITGRFFSADEYEVGWALDGDYTPGGGVLRATPPGTSDECPSEYVFQASATSSTGTRVYHPTLYQLYRPLIPGGPSVSADIRQEVYPILGPTVGLSMSIRPATFTRDFSVGFRWWDASGAVVGTDTFATGESRNNVRFQACTHTATPPAGAVSWTPLLRAEGSVNGDLYYMMFPIGASNRFGVWSGPRSIFKELTVTNGTGVSATFTMGVRPTNTLIDDRDVSDSQILFEDIAVPPNSIVAFSLNTVLEYGEWLWAKQGTADALTLNVSGVHIY